MQFRRSSEDHGSPASAGPCAYKQSLLSWAIVKMTLRAPSGTSGFCELAKCNTFRLGEKKNINWTCCETR